MITQSTYLGYNVNVETGEIDAPVECYACNQSVASGHFCCSTSPDDLLEDERDAEGCYRSYHNGVWRWFAPIYAYKSD